MPYISTEALLGAALLIVFAIGYQYLPKSGSAKAAKKKNKKKTKATAAEESTSDGSPKRGSPKGKRKTPSLLQDGAATVQATKQAGKGEPTPNEATNGAASFAAVAGGSQAVKPKTLVEKLAPKQRKTKVDDMLAPEDRAPTYARVMTVVPAASANTPTSAPAPAPLAASAPELAPPVEAKISKYEADYASSSEDETSGTGTAAEIEEDDGWDVVPSKKKKALSISMQSGPSQSGSTPLPVSTKIQRKNARKAEAKKAAKVAEEADRQRRLAMHKRDIEKERINEIYNQKKAAAKGSGGGGARATVDANGKLIWD